MQQLAGGGELRGVVSLGQSMEGVWGIAIGKSTVYYSPMVLLSNSQIDH